MTPPAEFVVTYWGATGSLTRPLLPEEVTDKLVGSLAELARQDALADVAALAADEDRLRELIQRRLPFHLHSTFGGNTSCIEIQTPDGLLVIDAGSGLRELGVALQHRFNAPDYQGSRQAHVLLTHAHMDHTYATPFCDAFYNDRNDFTLWAPQPVLDSLEAVLGPSSQLSGLYFPQSYEALTALRKFRRVEAGRAFSIAGTEVSTLALNHPGGCLAYRLARGGRSLVFASDHEHPEVPDMALAEFASGAELLYMDAQYLQEEYDGRRGIRDEPPMSRRGWGHSPVEACIPTGVAAGARHLHLGHHEPKRADKDLARLEEYAQRLLSEALSASGRDNSNCQVKVVYEGLSLCL